MILIPIGHDQAIRRVPWLTIAIMVVCTLLQVIRMFTAPSAGEIEGAAMDREQREQVVVERYSPSSTPPLDPAELVAPPPLVKATTAEPSKILAEVRAGRLGDVGDPTIAALRESDARFEAVLSRDLAQRFGHRPSKHGINMLLAAFVHGGLLHLLGNMLFLWLCGCNLEDRWGPLVFGIFYALSAIVASLAYSIWHPGSNVPLVGASGAIAGAMGAFLVCYHAAQIKYWYMWRLRTGVVYIQALFAFPIWFGAQLLQSWLEVHGIDQVAYSAHVGGFVFGFAIALVLKLTGLEANHLLPRTQREEKGWEASPEEIARYEEESLPPRPAPVAPMHVAPAGAIEEPPLSGLGEGVVEVPVVDPQAILAQQPERTDVRYALLLTAIGARDTDTIQLSATRVIVWLAEQERWRDIVDLYVGIEPLGAVSLGDRAYSLIVRAAAEAGEPKLCVRVATAMQARHGQSPLMPRAIWDVAAAQEKAGRKDLVSKTLTRLVTTYPDHVFANEARNKLATLR